MSGTDGKTQRFPKEFVWGAATAAYQIEGAAREDGRGPSVWDMLCAKEGAIDGGATGDVASNHYHHVEEDLTLLQELGLGGYRFSIAWPRVLPEGTGRVNAPGLDFYDRLVDGLLERGIRPYATLFHWDLPLALYHRGGWLNPDSAEWFAQYAATMAAKLGDRVRDWITLNEPQVFIGHGHYDGRHAPGLKYSLSEMLLCGHHALMAHGRGVQALRANSPQPCRIGFAPMGFPKIPASDSAVDLAATREVMFSVVQPNHWNLVWWADPVLRGSYPESGLKLFGRCAPEFTPEQLALIAEPTDFLGLNIYQGSVIEAGAEGPSVVPFPDGFPITGFNWPMTPEALYWGPRWAHERYGKPLLITENGLSCRDWPSIDGRVHDAQRIDFISRQLRELHRAVSEGVPVEGYFHWSALDNFEWAEGYKERFGLVHVDYPTSKRTPKDSYYWYQRVIETGGAAAIGPEALQAHALQFSEARAALAQKLESVRAR